MPYNIENFYRNPEDVPEELQKYIRKAWVPTCTDEPMPENHLDRFGGVPLILEDETWVTCTSCDKPFSFMGQFEMPEPGCEDFYQVFGCPEHDHDWNVSKGYCRIIDKSIANPKSVPGGLHQVKHEAILKWNIVYDIPSIFVLGDMDLGVSKQTMSEYAKLNYGGTKAGGWPTWTQEVATPTCCHKEMNFLFQLYEHPSEGWMWGTDCGLLYVFKCDECGKLHSQEDGA